MLEYKSMPLQNFWTMKTEHWLMKIMTRGLMQNQCTLFS